METSLPKVTITPQLGHKIRDLLSGVEGLANCIVEKMNGTVRLGLQPMAKEGGPAPEALEIDIGTLEYVDDGLIHLVRPARPCTHVTLGDKVQDTVTGFKGICVARVTFINGCVYMQVEGKVNKQGESRYSLVSVDRLVLIKAAKEPVEAAPTKPGGPMTRGGYNLRG